MNLDLEQALQTFFEESNDLLGDMERILLDLEMEDTTPEQLNALFRAMHTIKGSAGLFALDDVVRFTHQVENALDRHYEPVNGYPALPRGVFGSAEWTY